MLLFLTNFLLALSMVHIVCTYITLFGKPQCRPILWYGTQGVYLCCLWAVTEAESPYPLVTLAGNILFLILLYRLAHRDSFKTCVFRSLIFFTVYMAVEVFVNCVILLVLRGEDVFLMGDAVCQIVMYLGVQIYGRIGPKKEEIPPPAAVLAGTVYLPRRVRVGHLRYLYPFPDRRLQYRLHPRHVPHDPHKLRRL